MLTMTIDRRGLEKKLTQLRSMGPQQRREAMSLAGRQIVAFVKDTFNTGGKNAGISWPGVNRFDGETAQPLVDSGTLRRSIAATVETDRAIVRVSGPASRYARAQHEGYAVLPTHNKFAWVPGGPYINIPMVKGASKRRMFSLKDYPGWRAMTMDGLGWVAAIPSGKEKYTDARGAKRERTKWKAIAMLRKKTKLKARPFLFWSGPLVRDINRFLGVYVRQRLRGENGGGN